MEHEKKSKKQLIDELIKSHQRITELETSKADLKRAEETIKASLREKEVLLKEIHHRVKNNLQIISSLLSLQSQYIKDKHVLEMFKDSQDRIRSMALIHEKLYGSRDLTRIDFAEYIKGLTKGLYRSYGVDPGRIGLNIKVENVSLRVDLAVPCGLIINELVSNALKYAFPPSWRGKGQIDISLSPTETNEIELVVQDNGIGMPEDLDIRQTESLGLRLVTILVEDQLDGRISLDTKKGTKFVMRMSLLGASS